MKQLCTKILMLLILTIAAQNAHAVIADKFDCEIKLKEYGSLEETTQQTQISVARMLIFDSAIPHGSMTKGSFDARLKSKSSKRTITANLTFYYSHAMRTDASGQNPEARQATCSAINVDICDHTGGKGDLQICSEGKSACQAGGDPFDPTGGWPEVSLAPDGTPLFDEKVLVPIEAKFRDDKGVERGTVKFSCAYKGTFS
jgi:hypothetical protein